MQKIQEEKVEPIISQYAMSGYLMPFVSKTVTTILPALWSQCPEINRLIYRIRLMFLIGAMVHAHFTTPFKSGSQPWMHVRNTWGTFWCSGSALARGTVVPALNPGNWDF